MHYTFCNLKTTHPTKTADSQSFAQRVMISDTKLRFQNYTDKGVFGPNVVTSIEDNNNEIFKKISEHNVLTIVFSHLKIL